MALGALARKRSEEPGVERQERRGNARERFDMRRAYSRKVKLSDDASKLPSTSTRLTPVDQVLGMFLVNRPRMGSTTTGSLVP